MPAHRISSPLAAAFAALLAACGPGDPPDGPGDPGDPGAGGGDAGGGKGAPPADGGGATAWVDVIGGAGIEHVQDLAAAPGGGVVALTAIGLDGERVHQLGLVAIDASGAELGARAFEVSARVRFGASPLAAAPQGHLFLAAGCPEGCGELGADVRGTALVRLTGAGEPQWIAALPGTPASNVVADAAGNAVLATREGGDTTVRSHGGDGAVRWALRASGGPVALAADERGNVFAASGAVVAALAGDGRTLWTQDLGEGVRVAALGGAGGAALAVGTSDRGVRGTSVGAGPFVVALAADGRVASARALGASSPGDPLLAVSPAGAAVVTRAASCAATVAALAPDGATRWSRPVAPGGCDGEELAVHGVEVLEGGQIAIGGALRGAADLGAGDARPEATDGFVAGLRP